tara:strand:+ start:892 stop:1764 length:873 start_codon:yes stop_codon:yes gene_type:complete
MSVKKLKINIDNEGRRIDNFLLSIYKNIPKTKIYKIIRKGEVRVNSSRIKAHYKLVVDDIVRIPPNLQSDKIIEKKIRDKDVEFFLDEILYNDNNYLVINKKRGISVHGGTKNYIGIIDIARKKYGKEIDLCHRLDKDTTGCLVLAKNKKSVKHFNESLKNYSINKHYSAILKGNLMNDINVDMPIYKNDSNKLKSSTSKFKIVKELNNCTLVDVQIFTGRTHQIRIHASSIGHPVLFDNKYGDKDFNKLFKTKNQKDIMLHSRSIIFKDMNSKLIKINSDIPSKFNEFF